MSRGKNCRETILSLNCLAVTLTAGVILKEEKMPSLVGVLWARDSFGGILGDNLGEVNCESKIVARQWGVNFCRETSRCLAGPSADHFHCTVEPSSGHIRCRTTLKYFKYRISFPKIGSNLLLGRAGLPWRKFNQESQIDP